jgi:O-antigen/teichoic acid export membrane protein
MPFILKAKFQFSVQCKGDYDLYLFIILSGSVATLLLDIDKLMLNQYIKIENIAYYSVATYIALVISVPSRAMHQIVYPITAKLMHEEKYDELKYL